jgi:hypothetical protein
VKTEFEKPRVTVITDPDLIESAKRDDIHDVLGAEVNGVWYGYSWSIEHYRRHQVKLQG